MMDKQTFEARVVRRWNALVRTARCIVRDESDAEDAAAQAVLNCYEALPRLRDEAFFETWLTRACINEARMILRRRKRVEPRDALPAPGAQSGPPDATLSDLLLRLPERDRLPLTLTYACDMTVDELARTLGVPRGTAASRVSRARKKLRHILEQEGFPHE